WMRRSPAFVCMGGDAEGEMRSQPLQGRLDADSILRAEGLQVAVFDELVRPADAHHWGRNLQLVQFFQNRTAESAVQDVILQSDDHLHAARVKLQHLRIDRLGKACIYD